MKHTHFFLGANSAEGFYGLYDQLLDARLCGDENNMAPAPVMVPIGHFYRTSYLK